MGMDETVVMRGDLHLVQFAQRGEFASGGEATHHRAVELQDADGAVLDQVAAAVGGQFTFAGG